jgi:hypothetical protein
MYGLLKPKTLATEPHWTRNSPLIDIRVQRSRCDFQQVSDLLRIDVGAFFHDFAK